MGICYGHQLICKLLGGKISKSKKENLAKQKSESHQKSIPIFKNLFKKNLEEVWMSHGDAVTELPKGFLELARSDTSPFSIIGDNIREFYGVQFHP